MIRNVQRSSPTAAALALLSLTATLARICRASAVSRSPSGSPRRRQWAAQPHFSKCSTRRLATIADEIMSAIVAKRLVEHLERSGLGRPLTAAQQSDGDNDGGRATKSLPAWGST